MAEPRASFLRAMRMAESGSFEGDYRRVAGLVRNQARLLGAYGIPSDEWDAMAEDAGIPEARWQDARAQDFVARVVFDRLYTKYGDWRLVAAAWKAGEAVADAIAAEPKLLSHKELATLRSYVGQVMAYANEDQKTTKPLPPPGSAPADPAVFAADTEAADAVFPLDFAGIARADGMGVAQPRPPEEEALMRTLKALRDHRRRQAESLPDEEDTATTAEVAV